MTDQTNRLGMFVPQNALYAQPQEPQTNALYYDDTAGMPRSRPADPLRWAADYIGQNKDLPQPQFFMDPRALSMRNMLHSALNTSANWLDGTRDPSLIGPQEMVSPLGLAGMGTGLTNAGMRMSRDQYMANALGRQHPDAVAGGNMVRYKDYTMVQPPEGRATPVVKGEIRPAREGGGVVDKSPDPAVWVYGGADNVNIPAGVSELPSPLIARSTLGKGYSADEITGARLARQHPEASPTGDLLRLRVFGSDRIGAEGVDSLAPVSRARNFGSPENVLRRPDPEVYGVADNMNTRGPYLMADNAKGSAPGVVVNSLADDTVRPGSTWYHGGPKDLEKLDAGKSRYASRPMSFVTDSEPLASHFGSVNKFSPTRDMNLFHADRDFGAIEPFLKQNADAIKSQHSWIKDPIDDVRSKGWSALETPQVQRWLQEQGYDGFRATQKPGLAPSGEVVGLFPDAASSMSKVYADNAKGSAPGTVVNSVAEPQTIRAYHGTDARFDRFDPSRTDEIGFHFGTKGQANARKWTKAEAEGTTAMPWPFSNWRNVPVDIEAKKIADLSDDPGFFGSTPLATQLSKDGVIPDDVLGKVRSIDGIEQQNSYLRQWLTDNGYDLVRYPNQFEGRAGSTSYMALGTGNVRNARTGKVMFSSPSASTPGLAANSTQPQDDSAVTDILRRYGLSD